MSEDDASIFFQMSCAVFRRITLSPDMSSMKIPVINPKLSPATSPSTSPITSPIMIPIMSLWIRSEFERFLIFSQTGMIATDQIGPINTSHQREILKGSWVVQSGVIPIVLTDGTSPFTRNQIPQNRVIAAAETIDHCTIFFCV